MYVCMYVLYLFYVQIKGQIKTNKDFVSHMILGKYVRKDLRKTHGSQLLISHMRKQDQ